jgi:hypothetical protein
VIGRIRQFAGVRFEPTVVDAFVRAYEKGSIVPLGIQRPVEAEEPMLREAL